MPDLDDPTNAMDAALGRRIRDERLSRGLTQTDLSRLVGVRYQQVQKYESGHNRVNAARLLTIARAFGISVADLVAGMDPSAEEASAPPARVAGPRSRGLDEEMVALARQIAALPEIERQAMGTLVHRMSRSGRRGDTGP